MFVRFAAVMVMALFASMAVSQDDLKLSWDLQDSGCTASLRGLCVVDENVAWASGTGGTVLKTIDGGVTWQNVSVTDADGLDFRDVHAFNVEVAVVINAGQPAVFYRTDDGGKNWKQVFQHDHEGAFFDAVAAINSDHLIAMSDPVDDRILLVESLDMGKTWSELPAERRPEKAEGEAGFAASGSNMIVEKDTGDIYLALGSHEEGKESPSSRVMVSRDGARTWNAIHVPMRRTQSSGIFSLACLPEVDFGQDIGKRSGVLVAVGGNYLEPEDQSNNVALGPFGELKNIMVPNQKPRGYRSGVTHTFINQKSIVLAVGPDGSDISFDNGVAWQAFNDEGFHAVKSAGDGVVWASGAEGRIARLVVSD